VTERPDRAALVAQLAALIGYLTEPEALELRSLMDALARRHGVESSRRAG
jgi:hypothetical protein